MTSLLLVSLVLIALVPAQAAAQAEEAPRLKTYPEDLGYGEQPVPADAHFQPLKQHVGPVDARAQSNPLAGRLIVWPTATILNEGDWSYRTVAFVEHRLSYSPSQGTELRVSSTWPGMSQYYLGVGARFNLLNTARAALTWGPSARYRRSGFDPGTQDLSLGLELVADVPLSDRSVLSVGGVLNVVAAFGYRPFDASTCETRYDFGRGECYFENTDYTWEFPSGGHWGSLFVGTNTHATDYLVFNLEVFTGAGSGSFMELNDFFERGPTYTDELGGFSEGELRAGLEILGPLTLGVGTTWIFGDFATQTSLMFTRFMGRTQLVPFLAIAYLGGQ
ncbi:hypothetical protein DV096_09780 [Bradymonadaceae bacterium TMQ3]|nr:hypothetical protein DV096_09780 [Bradymonadaceae bacterium TMQ3]